LHAVTGVAGKANDDGVLLMDVDVLLSSITHAGMVVGR
jgi:hypothetical protein